MMRSRDYRHCVVERSSHTSQHNASGTTYRHQINRAAALMPRLREGTIELAVDSHFAWADLGSSQSFQ